MLGGVIGPSVGPIFIFNGGVVLSLSLVAGDDDNVAPASVAAAVGVTAEQAIGDNSSVEVLGAWESSLVSRSPLSLWSLPWSAAAAAKI